MVHLGTVEEQLKTIGCNFKFFGRPEIKELAKILLPGETIAQCTNGYYEGGIALLVVTDHRLLLVDRKPMYLTIEDLRFDMISEIDFSHRLFNATIRIFSTNKSLMFTSWNHTRLRRLVEYLQHRVVMIRNHQQHSMMQQLQQFAQMSGYDVSLPQPQQPALPEQSVQTYAPAGLAQLALQASGDSSAGAIPAHLRVDQAAQNAYRRVPLLARRRKFPKFY